MKNEKIINAWNKIEPSDETKEKIFDDIMQKRQQKRKKNPRFIRKAIIAAALTVLLSIMSVMGYITAITVFDFDGKAKEYTPPYYMENGSQSPEMAAFETEFYINDRDVFCFISYKEVSSSIPPSQKITDYEELKEYLDGDVFILPQYIPDGYEFSRADIKYNLDGNINLEEFELIYYEEKFDRIYEKYLFPENQKIIENLGSITITYEKNGENWEKDEIIYSIEITPSKNIQFAGTEVEKLNLPQFEKSIFVKNEEHHIQYSINAIKSCSPKYCLNTVNISKIWRERHKGAVIAQEYKTAFYNIRSFDDSENTRDELIKIAESIK